MSLYLDGVCVERPSCGVVVGWGITAYMCIVHSLSTGLTLAFSMCVVSAPTTAVGPQWQGLACISSTCWQMLQGMPFSGALRRLIIAAAAAS